MAARQQQFTYSAAVAEAAVEAAAILREADPRTGPEQAALDAIAERPWVLWHAKDYSLGVIRLLSCKGLLRDIAQEKAEEQIAISNAKAVRRDLARGRKTVHALDAILEQACMELETGKPPADVAAWVRDARNKVMEAHDRRA